MTPLIQDYLTAALANWAIGKPEDFKDLLRNNPNLLNSKSGSELGAYFLPMLYIRELCTDAMSVGFPVEDIIARNTSDFLWVDWPEVVTHVGKYAPHVLQELSKNQFNEDNIGDVEPLGCFDPNSDDNACALYDHWPRLLCTAVKDKAEEFVNSSNAQWKQRQNIVAQELEKKIRRPAKP